MECFGAGYKPCSGNRRDMDVSIIIPTYKRKESVLRLLASLVSEMKENYEILISEQIMHHGDEFLQFGRKHKMQIQYIFSEIVGTSHAKNIAAKKAKGKYFIFFDDDVVVHTGIIENLVKVLHDPQTGAVGGRVVTPGQTIDENNKNVGRITFLGNFSDAFSSKIPQQIDTVIGCNCAWRRDVFEKIGGFDEQFTGAIREDSDISLRTKGAG